MKLSALISPIVLVVVFASAVNAQSSANQTLNLTVSPITRIAISGAPISLTVSNVVSVGSDVLASATDNTTNYSMTHNSATALRITAALDQALPAGYTLQVALAPSAGKGTSAGTVDISNATAASAVNVVTAIPRGADANRAITYTFGAAASAGALASTARTVTLTLTN